VADFAGGSNAYGNGGSDGNGGVSGESKSSNCARATGRIHGGALGRARLGQARAAVRSVFPSFSRRRAGVDRFCIRGGGHIRIGYLTERALSRFAHRSRSRERAVLILTTSRHYSIRRTRPGSSLRALKRQLGRMRSFRIGRNRWYIGRGHEARLVFKVHRGRVEELGIAARGPTRVPRRAKRFLASFPG
jgi:hypothetical protein